MKVKNTSQRKIELHEPEIKWRSKGHKLVAKITQSSSWIRKTSCDLALEYNLSPEQCSMLRALYDNQGVPISTNQLRYLMLTPLSDTPKLVDKLLKKELIVKKANAHDKRLVAISITAKGIDILEKLQTKSVSFWEHLPDFTIDDTKQLIILLDKLKVSIKAALPKIDIT